MIWYYDANIKSYKESGLKLIDHKDENLPVRAPQQPKKEMPMIIPPSPKRITAEF